MLIALLEEAGNMIRRVPSLLFLPLLLLASLLVASCLFFVAFLALATATNDQLMAQMQLLNLENEGVDTVRTPGEQSNGLANGRVSKVEA